MTVRIWIWGVVVVFVLIFLVHGWLPLGDPKNSAIQPVKLTNVSAVMVGAPKFLQESRQLSFEGVTLPKYLSKDDISEIAAQISRVYAKGNKVSHVEACWEDAVFAVRVHVGKSSIFLAKDSSASWQVLRVFHFDH